MHLSSDLQQYWHRYQITSTDDPNRAIKSSPAIANLDGQTCIIFGCNNGKVYAIHSDGSSVSGWNGGILLRDGMRTDPESGSDVTYSIRTSPLVGNVVTETNDPQVIVGCIDGNIYALWKDGTNHAGGPVARVWTCAQTDDAAILATPTLCSLSGTTLDLIVGSTDGIYRINFPSITFDSANTTRWPWTTFHYDAARTGCTTAPSTTMVSSSIVGRVKSGGGTYIQGASVKIEWYNTSTSSWVMSTPVFGRSSETRTNPILTAGAGGANDELNEGGFVISQLTPNRRYRLTISKTGYTTKVVSVNSDLAIPTGKITMADITL